MTKIKFTPPPLLCWDLYTNGISEEITNIPIGGVHKQSLIDYPGKVSAVFFTCGCNFRCAYCHNPGLVYDHLISGTKKHNCFHLIEWVEKNRKLLDAVVITGGEPTIHPSLPTFIRRIKALGLQVKLDTNGTNPQMLESLITKKLIDYVAMDIKAPLTISNYTQIVGPDFNQQMLDNILSSVNMLNKKEIDHEFRTTLDKNITINDILTIINSISGKYYIQVLRNDGAVLTPAPIMEQLKKLPPNKNGVQIRFR